MWNPFKQTINKEEKTTITAQEVDNTNTDNTSRVGNRYRIQFLKSGHVLKAEGVITDENIDGGYFYFKIVDECCHSDTPVDSPQLKAWMTPMKIYYNEVIKSARIYPYIDW